MSKREVDPEITVSPVQEAETTKFLVLCGPGNVGKTTCAEILIELARSEGRDPVIADGDRNEAGLTSIYGQPGEREGEITGLERPLFSDDITVVEWLDRLVTEQDVHRRSIVLDMGGGDLIFSRYAKERELVSLLGMAGIIPVAVHLISPSPSDLGDLKRSEGEGFFCPPATILALNAGPMKDTRDANAIFAAVRADPTYRQALARGAKEIIIPTLSCMRVIEESGLPFDEAIGDPQNGKPSPLGLSVGNMGMLWRRRLKVEMQKVKPWLP